MQGFSSAARRLSLAALAAVAAAGISGEGIARAEAPRIALRWSAPQGCPDGAKVSAEVDRLLGPGGARPPKPIEVSATVSLDEPSGFRVHLETSSGEGTRVREVRGATCAAIANATALIVAMIIDPNAVDAARVAPPSAGAAEPLSPPPSPASTPSLPSPLSPRAPPATRPPLSLGLFAWGGADAGSLPGVAPGFGGAAALFVGPQRFELGAALWPSQSITIAPGAGGAVDLFAGSAGTCRDLGGGRVQIGPCLAFELGRMHARGFGVTQPGDAAELWAAVKGGGVLGWSPARGISLSLRLDAVFPLLRPTFVLQGIGSVHRAGAVAGRAETGLEIHFSSF